MDEFETEKWVTGLICQNNLAKFYHSYKWVKFRSGIMLKKKNRCEICWNGGTGGKGIRKYKKAAVLHHIKHLRYFPKLALSETNMMALCEEHHREMHPKKIFTACKKVTKERWD